MNDTLKRCLDDLEARINPEEEERLLSEWRAFSKGEFDGDLFSPRRAAAVPPRVEWPWVSVNAALDDYDAMALQQYGGCSAALAAGNGMLMNVRSNFGTSILPLLFGVELYVMAEDLNTLPTSRPLNDVDAIKRIVRAGIPDLNGGYGSRVFAMGERMADIRRQYPKIGKYVHIIHPDLQGPMDVCEVIWGSTIFYSLYDEPELVKDLLALVTETYIAFARAWMQIVPFEPEGNCHWGYFHQGNLMLRDDSAMNLSPRQYEEFIRPYDQQLFDALGGGAIHYCGKGDHFIAAMSEMRGLTAVNLSQPHLNDMEQIFAHTVDRGIPLIGLQRAAAEKALRAGRELHGLVNC